MKTLDFFRKCRRSSARIDSLVEQQERLRALAARCTAGYSPTPMGGGTPTSKVEATIGRIVELEHDINAEIDRLVDMKGIARDVVESLTDDRQRDALTMYYLNCWPWAKVARKMHYDRTALWRFHVKALEAAQPALDEILAARGWDATQCNIKS